MEYQWLFDLILPVLTGFIGWFFARRKNKAEANRAEIENSDLVNVVLQKNNELLSEQLQKVLGDLSQLRKESLEQTQTIYELHRKVVSQTQQIDALQYKIAGLKSHIEKLENSNEKNSTINNIPGPIH